MSQSTISLLAIATVLIPLAGALCAWVTRGVKNASGLVATGACVASFGCAATLFFSLLGDLHSASYGVMMFDWIDVGKLKVPFAFEVSALSLTFALIITGIGSLIHLFSIGYMSHDHSQARYFSYLNLFVASMLALVFGENLVVTFVGWEGVGLCSYLLIGFWFANEDYAKAGRKAFVMNRIGDIGFLVAFGALFYALKDGPEITFSYSRLNQLAVNQTFSIEILTVIGLGFFLAAAGKSAQFPLFTWLPDAMAGPTPVSALIHAATMVTSGIFLACKARFIFDPEISPLFQASSGLLVPTVIATAALITAFVGATTALFQNDIKKVLAYSTVSQLGFMFLAVSCGAPIIALFHVLTHAFFKACLFLGAGSIIHACDGEQDMRKYGGLFAKLPWTSATFLVASLALAGLFPLSGYYSKHLIIESLESFPGNHVYKVTMEVVANFAAAVTALYMTRVGLMTFGGSYRGEKHPHEAPLSMVVPLIVLAGLSIVGGYFEHPLLELVGGPRYENLLRHSTSDIGSLLIANIPALVGIGLGLMIFGGRTSTLRLPLGLSTLLEHKYYLDEIYDTLIVNPFAKISKTLARFWESVVIEGTSLSLGYLVDVSGEILRRFASGQVAHYMLWMFGALAVIVYSTFKG